MTMTPYNTNLTQSLKWLHNNAPHLQSIIKQKNNWYSKYNGQFWENWRTTVFDIRTANSFGLQVWCIILGLPSSPFSLAEEPDSWAFGSFRQNYVSSGFLTAPLDLTTGPNIYETGTVVPPAGYTYDPATSHVTFVAAPANAVPLTWTGTITTPSGQSLKVQTPRRFGTGDGSTKIFSLVTTSANPVNIGGNFYGGGSNTVSILNEARQALQLRYCALVSNGNMAWINKMLNYIFNEGEPWDIPGKRYFYVTDLTMGTSPVATPPPTKNMYMEYRIGANLPLSDQLITIMNTQAYGIMPTVGGVGYKVIQES